MKSILTSPPSSGVGAGVGVNVSGIHASTYQIFFLQQSAGVSYRVRYDGCVVTQS